MRILVSGASGMIGSALAEQCAGRGYELYRLVRRAVRDEREIYWDPYLGTIQLDLLEGFDAVVHLAGQNLAAQRWNARFKKLISDSRIVPTRFLVDQIQKLRKPPAIFISASGTNFYGNRGDEILTESSLIGERFLARVCRDWEAAAMDGAGTISRVSVLRIGAVLDPSAGALAKMLPYFRKGLRAIVGNGRQYFPWISLRDTAAAIMHILEHAECRGPFNLVAPQAVTQREFASTLARVLKKPLIFRLPGGIARLLFGGLAQESLLSSVRATPRSLLTTGFIFSDPLLEPALQRMH